MIVKSARPAVVILAAGLSDRMGKPKYDLRFSEEAPFLDHIIRIYQKFVTSQIVVVVNDRDDFEKYFMDENLKIVVNRNPESGRFLSIQLGINEIKDVTVFIQNVDNPFVSVGLLMTLESGIEQADYTVPVYEGKGGHPVLLSQSTAQRIVNDFSKEEKLNEVLTNFERKDIPVHDPYILVNINTPEDYQKYFSRD